MRNLIILGAFCAALLVMECNAHAAGPLERLLGNNMATRGDTWAQSQAAGRPWHGNYYYLPYGQPTALVVPPTASMQSNYSWGVSQNTMTPIYHQFGAAAVPSASGSFYGTPRWPSHTNQFGVYPGRRAPW